MGEVIEFAEIARERRDRARRAVHGACRRILERTVVVARAELHAAPPDERPLRSARLRKLEDLEAYAATLG